MPAEEQKLTDSFSGTFLSGNREMNPIRETAISLYKELVTRIAATPCHQKTLRKILSISETQTSWWYHKVSGRGVEHDPTFNYLLQILTISQIAQREKIDQIALYGSSLEVAEVLASKYSLTRYSSLQGRRKLKEKFPLLLYLYGGWLRIRYLYHALQTQLALRQIKLSTFQPDVVFQGFWDWSVNVNESANQVQDHYFISLPEKLEMAGFHCAWFVWFAPHLKPGSSHRSLAETLGKAKNQEKIIFLQKFLKISDIVLISLDVRPLIRYIRFSHLKAFQALFVEKDLDFWPLFRQQLMYHFATPDIAHHTLIECASRRAFAAYLPKLSFVFQELFLYARAFYQGQLLGSPDTIQCAIQHASYNREKALMLPDPIREYQGIPDNYAIPKPNYIFAMGELGRDLFREAGFSADHVFLTGSTKYDHIRIISSDSKQPLKQENRSKINVLLALTLNRALEFELIQAAYLVAKKLPQINLLLRSHPFAKMEDWPAYQPYRSHIFSTKGSLKEDLAQADLVLFSYSSVAEEALLLGIPAWQWVPPRFNGSVFRDIPAILSFSTLKSLEDSLQAFIENPQSFLPNQASQECVLRHCFYQADGLATQRIASKIIELVS